MSERGPSDHLQHREAFRTCGDGVSVRLGVSSTANVLCRNTQEYRGLQRLINAFLTCQPISGVRKKPSSHAHASPDNNLRPAPSPPSA